MMVSTERTSDNWRNTIGSRLPHSRASNDADLAAATWPGAQRKPAEKSSSLEEELLALRQDHAKLQQAIFEAAQVQRRLCAPREHSWGEFQIAGEIFPVRHLSGDFFKVMEFPCSLGLVLGDIAGKGLSAGIWQAHLMGLIQRAARRHGNPSEAVAEVNHELCHNDSQPPLTALFLARIDSETQELVYCNAGLPAPLLLRDKKVLERLEEGGPMLGAVEKANFLCGRVLLNPGDMLIAYSDGVTECRNTEDQEFETDGLAAAAKIVSGASASKALFSLLATVLDFADSCSLNDDLTLLVVRRRDTVNNEKSRSRAKDSTAPHHRRFGLRGRKTPAREDKKIAAVHPGRGNLQYVRSWWCA
jgi:serine phosphatase RsbU (regulator of sigma subunit)